MWDLPRPGLEPVSPALAGRFLTTAKPRKSSPSFLKDSFVRYGILGVFLFFVFFQGFKSITPLPCSLQSCCWEICWKSYWGSLEYHSHFSLTAFKILFLSLTFNHLTIMCLCGYLWTQLTWNLLKFLCHNSYLSSNRGGGGLAIISSNKFPTPTLSVFTLGLP